MGPKTSCPEYSGRFKSRESISPPTANKGLRIICFMWFLSLLIEYKVGLLVYHPTLALYKVLNQSIYSLLIFEGEGQNINSCLFINFV